MKRMMLVWVMVLCMVPLHGFTEENASGQPLLDAAESLIGLWEYKRTDDLDIVFTAYAEFTPDGL